jgi:DNA protecting protein DprA
MKAFNSQRIELLYKLMNIKGIGSVKANEFIIATLHARSIEAIENEMKKVLNSSQLSDYENNKGDTYVLDKSSNVHYLSQYEDNYPEYLKNVLGTAAPPILSYCGNINLLNKARVGISGSRHVSDKGIRITYDISKALAENGVVVVSGYANGVDSIAHRTALENGGSTIVVLAEGLYSFSVKKEFKGIWDWNKVLVISEFRPTDKWMEYRAMKRNSTIIGLSDAVIVVEAGIKGGSFDAGCKVLDMKRGLFVPKYAQPPMSAIGNDELIKRGASPITMSSQTYKPKLDRVFELLTQVQHTKPTQLQYTLPW